MTKEEHKRLLLISTPTGENYFFKKWVDCYFKDDHDIVQEKLDALENFEDDDETKD
jgi:hypothetical protein